MSVWGQDADHSKFPDAGAVAVAGAFAAVCSNAGTES